MRVCVYSVSQSSAEVASTYARAAPPYSGSRAEATPATTPCPLACQVEAETNHLKLNPLPSTMINFGLPLPPVDPPLSDGITDDEAAMLREKMLEEFDEVESVWNLCELISRGHVLTVEQTVTLTGWAAAHSDAAALPIEPRIEPPTAEVELAEQARRGHGGARTEVICIVWCSTVQCSTLWHSMA